MAAYRFSPAPLISEDQECGVGEVVRGVKGGNGQLGGASLEMQAHAGADKRCSVRHEARPNHSHTRAMHFLFCTILL
jgi:hypothetical protein